MLDVTVEADLHIHSNVSDGSEGFEQIIRKAQSRGLTHIAFTNHDTLYGLSDALALQNCYNVKIIGGVEISAWDNKEQTKVHLLGYGFIDENAKAISELCASTIEQRIANSLWQLQRLLDAGYEVDEEALGSLASSSTCLYKQHIMAALTNATFNSPDYIRLYNKHFKGDGICNRDISYVDAFEALEAIKEVGGIAVLAHPGQYNNYALVEQLVALGLDGIEKYHPAHSPKDHKIIDQLAESYELLITGGSDYHGVFGNIKAPGDTRVSPTSNDALYGVLQELAARR